MSFQLVPPKMPETTEEAQNCQQEKKGMLEQQYNEGAECIHKVYGELMDLQLINEMVFVLKNSSGLDEHDKRFLKEVEGIHKMFQMLKGLKLEDEMLAIFKSSIEQDDNDEVNHRAYAYASVAAVLEKNMKKLRFQMLQDHNISLEVYTTARMDRDEEDVREEIMDRTLPYNVVRFLAKSFLPAKDRLALAFSGALNEDFISYHGNNRKCDISRCYFLTLSRWDGFFKQHIHPGLVTVFYSNHCYWLPPQVLIGSIKLMENLEELSVLDTQIKLEHLMEVFASCQKVTKLGFSLAGTTTLEEYRDEESLPLKNMKQCFKKLTHLKLFNFTGIPNPYQIISLWPITLEVLSWCGENCVDLNLELAYATSFVDYARVPNWNVIDSFRRFLGWMRSLQTLVVTKRYCFQHETTSPVYDPVLGILFESIIRRPANSLRRLWIDDNHCGYSTYNGIGIIAGESAVTSSVTSLVVSRTNLGDNMELILANERFRHLKHLGCLRFKRLVQLPDLQYACGDWDGYDNGLSEFCEAHPMLEYLRVNRLSRTNNIGLSLYNYKRWNLNKLKVLIFRCTAPYEGLIDYQIDSCPNIKTLLIGSNVRLFPYTKTNPPQTFPMDDSARFLSDIRFIHLKSLFLVSLNFSNGSFLLPILEQCPKLEVLHLSGKFENDEEGSFLSRIGKSLPTATHLRDFSLEWFNQQDNFSETLLLLRQLLKCSSHLERLLLHDVCAPSDSTEPQLSSDFGDQVVHFAYVMDHLVALCLTGIGVDPVAVAKVRERVKKEVLPLRPSLWFHMDRDLPKGNDLEVPRIHYDEMVNPQIWICGAQPSF